MTQQLRSSKQFFSTSGVACHIATWKRFWRNVTRRLITPAEPLGHEILTVDRRKREGLTPALVVPETRLAAPYKETGRPSIAPARLLRAILLPLLYSILSERLLMERLDFDLLFRWLAGLWIDDPVCNALSVSKKQIGIFIDEIAQRFPHGPGAESGYPFVFNTAANIFAATETVNLDLNQPAIHKLCTGALLPDIPRCGNMNS